MMNIPEEIRYKILSYLPREVLSHLNLSNKQYWNIYRTRNVNCPWENDVIWLEKLLDTTEIYLKDHIYVHTLYGLCSVESEFSRPVLRAPTIPVQEGVVSFKNYLDGYVWHPCEHIDFTTIKQILNEENGTIEKTTSKFRLDLKSASNGNKISREKILNFFMENIAPYIDIIELLRKENISDAKDFYEKKGEKLPLGFNWALNFVKSRSCTVDFFINQYNKLKTVEPEDIKLSLPMLLYLKESAIDWKEEELKLTEPTEIIDNILFKVVKICNKSKKEGEIGRAVLSSKLYDMFMQNAYFTNVGPKIGVALFGNKENKVFGLGNFNCRKALNVFQSSKCFIVRSTSLTMIRRESESDWESIEEEEEENEYWGMSDSDFDCDEESEFEEEEDDDDDETNSDISRISEYCLDRLFNTGNASSSEIDVSNITEDCLDQLFNTGYIST